MLTGLSLAGGASFAAEFEVLDRFSVDGYSEFRGSAAVSSGLFTVGASTLVIKNGNIGIGTTTPAQKLDVNVTSNFDGIRVGGGAQAPSVKWITNNTAGSNWAISTNKQALGDFAISNMAYGIEPTDSAASLVISSAGSVGIGTVSPATRLDVSGAGTGAAPAVSGTTDPTTNFRAGRGTVGVDIGMIDNGTGYLQNRDISNFAVNYNFSLQPNGGNVGIGTTGPAAGYKLDAAGAGGTGIRITDTSNTSSLRFQWADSTGTITAAKDGAIATTINFNTQTAAGATTNTLSLNAGNVGIGTTGPGARLEVAGGLKLANDAAICDTSKAGTIRWNGTNFQGCTGSVWRSFENVPLTATGGAITYSGAYTIHTFTASGTFTPNENGNIELLVVAGGGGGAGGPAGAGGGAGGLVYNASFAITPQAYTVTVGPGGAGGAGYSAGTKGSDSVFSSITAFGGGPGPASWQKNAGNSGGSGSGGSGYDGTSGTTTTAGGAGTAGQGNTGGVGRGIGGNSGAGGGGGGAGAVGGDSTTSSAGNGGSGLASSITGASVTYAGGGAGSGYGYPGGTGGAGGGGSAGSSGAANTGGGGGAGTAVNTGGSGGSGIVIIRYPTK